MNISSPLLADETGRPDVELCTYLYVAQTLNTSIPRIAKLAVPFYSRLSAISTSRVNLASELLVIF